MATTATISGFFEPILRAVVNQGMRTQPEEYPGFVQVLEGTKHKETFREWVGLGLPAAKGELDPVQMDDPIQGNIKEYTFSVVAKGFRASYESMEDDQYDIITQTSSSLGDCMREYTELDAANVWNNAFSGDPISITTFDGQPIISNAHTRLDGGPNRSNLFTGDPSLALMESFRYFFRNDITDRGFKNQRTLAAIIIAPDSTVEPLVDQFLGGAGMQPFTADHTPHELGEMRGRITKKVYSYLADTDRCIGLASDALTKVGGPFYMWRRRASMTSWDDDAIQASCFATSQRGTFGCPDYHSIAGSTGV